MLEEVTILLDESFEEKKTSKNKTKSKSKKEEKNSTSMKKHKKTHKEKILINPEIIQPQPL
jgi:F0F1-type ATP synthase epsilon subunit